MTGGTGKSATPAQLEAPRCAGLSHYAQRKRSLMRSQRFPSLTEWPEPAWCRAAARLDGSGPDGAICVAAKAQENLLRDLIKLRFLCA